MQFNLKSRLQPLKLVSGLATFMKNPDSFEGVVLVSRSLQNNALSTQIFRHLLANSELAALVQEHWRPGAIDLDALLALPEGILGHVYAHQLRSQGLTPESLIDPTPVRSPEDYIMHRLRETHDIVQVLTDFGTDGPG